MTDPVKPKKKPKSYPDVLALQRCLRLLEDLDVQTRARVARQLLEKAQGDLEAEYRDRHAKQNAQGANYGINGPVPVGTGSGLFG